MRFFNTKLIFLRSLRLAVKSQPSPNCEECSAHSATVFPVFDACPPRVSVYLFLLRLFTCILAGEIQTRSFICTRRARNFIDGSMVSAGYELPLREAESGYGGPCVVGGRSSRRKAGTADALIRATGTAGSGRSFGRSGSRGKSCRIATRCRCTRCHHAQNEWH